MILTLLLNNLHILWPTLALLELFNQKNSILSHVLNTKPLNKLQQKTRSAV